MWISVGLQVAKKKLLNGLAGLSNGKTASGEAQNAGTQQPGWCTPLLIFACQTPGDPMMLDGAGTVTGQVLPHAMHMRFPQDDLHFRQIDMRQICISARVICISAGVTCVSARLISCGNLTLTDCNEKSSMCVDALVRDGHGPRMPCLMSFLQIDLQES